MVTELYSSSGIYSGYNSISSSQRLVEEIARAYNNTQQTQTNSGSTEAQKRHAASILDDNLSPMAEAYRNIFSTQDEIEEYIYNKYFETPRGGSAYKASDVEKYAMYQNDFYAVFYGIDEENINMNDPRINFSEEDWEKVNLNPNNLDRINKKMQEIVERNNLELEEDSYYVMTFNPYTFEVTISGNENNANIQALSSALNQNQNSTDLFLYALQNSKSLNQNSVNKMYAYQNVLKYTGENLQNLTLSDGVFYNSNNENILDVIKNNMQNSFLTGSYMNSQYNNISDYIQNIAKVGWNNIPDLELSMVYSMREGIFVPGVVYNI